MLDDRIPGAFNANGGKGKEAAAFAEGLNAFHKLPADKSEAIQIYIAGVVEGANLFANSGTRESA
jgi:hypothetical protein